MADRIDFAADVRRLLASARAPRRLTRRERAALSLALEVLRRGVADHGSGYRWIRGAAAFHVGSAYNALIYGRDDDGEDPVPHPGEHVDSRLLRARLALYLRARLRADRGDCGRAWCPVCGRRVPLHHVSARYCLTVHGGRRTRLSRRITPLWQQAPAHEEDR